MEENDVGCYLTQYTKIDSEWIEDLTVRPKTVKLLEENGGKFHNIGLAHILLDMTPKAQATKTK